MKTILKNSKIWNFLLKVKIQNNKLHDTNRSRHSDLEAEIRSIWKKEQHKITKSFAARGFSGELVLAPWLGEIGYEVLYWIPFLNQMAEKGAIDKSRLTVISRGGVREWYKDIADNYIEIYDYLTPEELNKFKSEKYKKTGTQKLINQDNSTEDEILSRIYSEGILPKNIYYPTEFFSSMAPLFSRLGKAAPFRMASDMLIHKQINSANTNFEHLTPHGKYICVNFYTRPSFLPSSEEYASLIASIDKLARRLEATVIQIDSGNGLDAEHGHFSSLPNWITSQKIYCANPSDNLEWQSTLINNSILYIGTYGGPSYIPLMYNVPAVALYTSRKGLNPLHEHVAKYHKLSTDSASWHSFSLKEFFEIFELSW